MFNFLFGPILIYESSVLFLNAIIKIVSSNSKRITFNINIYLIQFILNWYLSQMFNINWGHTCHECRCPLEVDLTVKEKDLKIFFRDFTTWAYLRPFSLYQNLVMYKFYGLVVRRVCVSCYYHPIRINLLNREVGVKKVGTSKKIKRSKTCQEIYDYFFYFTEFRLRKDLVTSCIVEEEKRTMVLGLEVFWEPPIIY